MRKSLGMLALVAGFALTGAAVPSASALQIGKPAVTPTSDIVNVRHGGGHGGMRHGGVGIRHGGFGIRHGHGIRHGGFGHRRHFGTRLYVAPLYGYGYGHRSCYWLKRKALNTGSRYWWRRYNACRWG